MSIPVTIAPVKRTNAIVRRYFRAHHILPTAAVVEPALIEYLREESEYIPNTIENGELVPTVWEKLTPEQKRAAMVVLFHTSEYI